MEKVKLSAKEQYQKYTDLLIEEEKERTKPEFHYLVQSIEDVLGSFSSLLTALKETKQATESNDIAEVETMKNHLQEASEQEAAPWYDEDLEMEREGCEWESEFYKKLSEICKCRMDELKNTAK